MGGDKSILLHPVSNLGPVCIAPTTCTTPLDHEIHAFHARAGEFNEDSTTTSVLNFPDQNLFGRVLHEMLLHRSTFI